MSKANQETIKALIEQGITEAQEISKSTGLSINRVYEIRKELGYSKRQLKALKEQKKTQEQTTNNNGTTNPLPESLETTSNPLNKPNLEDVRYFIPTRNGEHKYIERRIGKKTDMQILEALYKEKMPTLIIGETGLGKTHLVHHFCFTHKLPIYRVNLNGSTTPEHLIGRWTPTTEGSFRWTDGILTTFVRHGGVIVIDELNGANAEILFCLHSLLDDDRQICLIQKDGEVIKAHKDFWLVASLPYEEEVLMKEGLKPIGEVVETNFEKFKNEIKIVGLNEVLDTKNKEIFCYSYDKDTKKIINKKITALIRHAPTDFLYELRLENNKTIRLTGSHSVFKEIGQPAKVSELKRGDKILAPSRIENNNVGNGILDLAFLRDLHKNHPILIDEKNVWWYRTSKRNNRYIDLDNPKLGWLLGFWIAEGSFSSTLNNKSSKLDIVTFSNKSWNLIRKVKSSFEEIFGIETYHNKDKRTGCYNVAVGTKIIAHLWRYWGLTTNCYNKKIPSFVFNSKPEFIKAFIEGMWDGDGTKCYAKSGNGKRYLEQSYATTSKTLANQLSYLLLFEGIKTCLYTRKPKNNRVKGYNVRIKKDRTKKEGSLQKLSIVSIKKIQTKPKYVYDFEVCDDKLNDNFIGGFGAILCHNTMNPDYEGTKPLNLALKDRFEILKFDYDEKVESKLVKDENMIGFAKKIRKLYKEQEIRSPLSTRTLMRNDKMKETFGKEIADIFLLNKFHEEEVNAIAEVLHIGKKDKPKEGDEKKEGEVKA